jgi:hypothetical protein
MESEPSPAALGILHSDTLREAEMGKQLGDSTKHIIVDDKAAFPKFSMDKCRVCGNHVVTSDMIAFSWKAGYKIQVEILPHGIPWSGIRCVCDSCAESIAVAIEDKRKTNPSS